MESPSNNTDGNNTDGSNSSDSCPLPLCCLLSAGPQVLKTAHFPLHQERIFVQRIKYSTHGKMVAVLTKLIQYFFLLWYS